MNPQATVFWSVAFGAIERACSRLCNANALRIDAYDYEGFVDFRSSDVVLNIFRREYPGHGRRFFLEAREARMICPHIVTNIEIEVIDAKTAKGVCYLSAYRAQNGLANGSGPLMPPIFLMGC